jgi:hypothetical protein
MVFIGSSPAVDQLIVPTATKFGGLAHAATFLDFGKDE